jgi:hypothetical protein
LLVALAVAAPAVAHHTGVYTPKDNAITTNFKQLKFSAQAGKFDVARRLFEEGPLRAEMRTRAATLPAGLEARTRAALQAGSAAEVERALMIFFVALARELAVAAERQSAARATAAATGPRFLEAIWRYYNLVDFAVSQRDGRGSAAMRLAFDDAEAAVKEPVRLPAAFRRIAEVLGGILEAGAK